MRTEFEREFDRIRGLHAEVQVDFNVGRPCHPLLHFDVGVPIRCGQCYGCRNQGLICVEDDAYWDTKSPSDSVAEIDGLCRRLYNTD